MDESEAPPTNMHVYCLKHTRGFSLCTDWEWLPQSENFVTRPKQDMQKLVHSGSLHHQYLIWSNLAIQELYSLYIDNTFTVIGLSMY